MKNGDGKKRKSNDHRIMLSSLKEENRILRAEIKRLNRILRVYSFKDSTKDPKDKSRELKRFEEAQNVSVALASSSYLKYVLAKISGASIYALIKKITKGFRRFKLVSTVIKVTSSILALLGTGAFFIFISGAMIFLIPLFLLVGLSAYLASMLFRKKAFKELENKLYSKSIIILFPPMGRPFKHGSRFSQNLNTISSKTQNDVLVIIISPFLISSKGFGGNGYFPVMRMERENVFIIRRNAFFALRRKLLQRKSYSVTYIY